MSIFYCNGQVNKKYTLAFDLTKGATYKQHCLMEMNIDQEIMGQKIHILTKMDIKMHYDVISIQNDLYDMQLLYDRIKMDMDAGGMSMSFDSNTTETVATASNMGPLFKAIIGIPVSFQFDKLGKIKSITGTEKIQEAMLEAVDSNMNEQAKQQIVGTIGPRFSKESISALFEQIGSYFPDKQVGIGDSWNVNTTVNNNGISLLSKITMTLKQIDGNVAVLNAAGNIETQEGGSVQKVQGMEAKVEVKGEQSGTVKIDMKTGWPVSVEISQKINGEMNVMNTTVPLVFATKATITTD
jgi:hypothetical protein